jgi:hypothetical protein
MQFSDFNSAWDSYMEGTYVYLYTLYTCVHVCMYTCIDIHAQIYIYINMQFNDFDSARDS